MAYNGRSFCGWQVQPHAPSVQGALEQALAVLFKMPLRVTGAGRTDTGVHARSYYAHFDLEDEVWAAALQRGVKATGGVGTRVFEGSYAACDDGESVRAAYAHWLYQLNALVGPDIALYRLFEVGPDMHARFSAEERVYHYYFHLIKNPFIAESSYFVRQPLDLDAMRRAAALLVGRRDFSAFEKSHGADNSHICDLRRADLTDLGDGRYVWGFSADRFLRNMVRAMVGTLLAVGHGKLPAAAMTEVLEARDRGRAGESVPAHALFLEAVRYPPGFDVKAFG